ncbi:hypothetical protein JCGZ_04691 [Jatropha curcas]|uniref:TPX2 C-terminal domain-containing protein n=1 Tax=Jatropha curcas TaxID=180498 RepID=A0A067KSS3_JATCU|nr:protein WVD2-like 7 [Jatropha curcas]KDP38048.1 hypothetical protein JCGZ_04691 [Jatropha curcas]
MAGEFEEPYNVSFQTDSLHSGSISFGRFESENLSWERRSSFSHNRYLEEVEKYSRPGSVTEKKAYFEAHFKKKGMRLPDSLEGQSGREYQSENDAFEDVGYREDDNVIESSNYDHSDEDVLENADYTEYDGYAGGQFDHANNSSQYANFDESPDGSEYPGEYERMEYEREDPDVLSSESQIEPASDNVLVECVLENVIPQEAHQTETRSNNNDRREIEVSKNLNGITANGEESISIDASQKSEKARIDQTTTVPQHNLSPKLRAAIGSKYIKRGLKSQVNSSQFKRSNYNDASKTVAKKQNRRDRESSQRMKSENELPQAAIPTRRSLLRTPKREDSEGYNSRSNLANKSEKEPKLKKVVESQPSGSKKVEPRTTQNANRLKQTASSAKADTRRTTAAFNFKSHERAERRKEFYMKLEEKMHAKEAEMNQIQARTQEKTEAEIKQLRKSLNFKATPMPSFYNSAASPGSSGNKATSSKTKLAKVHQKSPSPGSRGATRSQLLSKSGHNNADSNVESFGTTDCHVIEPREAGETLPANIEAVMKNSGTGKESEKVKESSLQRHRMSENSKVSKDQRVEGKLKMGNRRNSSEMVRKNIEGVGIGSSSGMGGVAVGVAS